MRWHGHISVNFKNDLLSSLSKCSISQPCTFYIFDKWAFFLHKLHHQICSRINAESGTSLYQPLWQLMKMDGIKQRLRFAKEKLSLCTVLAKGKLVFKGKKIELSNCLILVESHGQPACSNTYTFVKQAHVKLSHTHPIGTSMFFSIRHLLLSKMLIFDLMKKEFLAFHLFQINYLNKHFWLL